VEAWLGLSTAVLLVNLGTPRSPTVSDVRRYLREFLSDPRVLDINKVARALLLHGVILRTRPRHSAEAYRKIFTPEGSPLLVESERLRDGVANALGDGYRVALAMRYGVPAIADVLPRLLDEKPDRLVVVPLWPQYASAVTGSCLAHVFELLAQQPDTSRLEIRTVPPFYDDPGWLASWNAVGGDSLRAFQPDHILFSYHGLPERQVRGLDPSGSHCLASESCCEVLGRNNRGCYRAQCFATTRGLVDVMGLAQTPWSIGFQSRMKGSPWIRPFSDELLPQLAHDGVRRLAVLCPAFVADCLETLEEVDIRLRDQWLELGGEELLRIPCPNAHPRFARAVSDWVRRQAETG
jgi:ferrochelatase